MTKACSFLLILTGVGCATAVPPKELMDARQDYTLAEQGPAHNYRPDSLHEAKVALDQAEEAFKQDSGSEKTRTLAYVADRRAKQATAEGMTAQAINDRSQYQAGAIRSQLSKLEETKGNLEATKGELNQTRQQLAMTGQALASEQQAHQAAEKRAKEAYDRLALASVPVKQEPRGMVITLSGSVLFASGKSALLPSAQTKLNEVAEALKDQQDHKLMIEGHTDSRGSDATNLELSQNRARSVKDYLVSRGLTSDNIEAVGLGPSRPVADNRSAEGRANNRRVEIIVKAIEPQ